MYKYNLTPPCLSKKQKDELFSVESLNDFMKKLSEKKEKDKMQNEMDLLIDTLIQKQTSILNKIQLVDEKAVAYKLSEKGEVIQNLIASLDVVEEQIDDSLNSFYKAEDSIGRAMERIKAQTIEAWLTIQEDFEGLEEAENEKSEAELKDTVHVKLDIVKHEQFMVRSSTPEFILSYVITDENGVARGGKKIINTEKYEGGIVTDFAVELIENYKEALDKGDTISYTGEFTL